VGTIICHDRRYPETSRILAMLGAEIMLCPTAAPGYAGRVHWEPLNRMRSVDTGMFTVYSNRAGLEWEKKYFGGSMIVDPFGEVMAQMGDEQNVVVSAVLDLELVDKARIDVPTLRDLRHDLYVKYYSRPAYDALI
jgi:N-carbamoylputrescine amidase